MDQNECAICAISETGLNGNKYVELSSRYTWLDANRDWSKGLCMKRLKVVGRMYVSLR